MPRQPHAGRDRLRRRGVGAHNLKHFHHIGGHEEVQSNHILGPPGHRGDLVDIHIRGVGGKNGPRFGCPIQLGENFFLELEIFECCLNDQISLTGGAIVEAGRNQTEPAHHLGLIDAAAVDHAPIVLGDHTHAPVQGVLRSLDRRHRDARIGEAHDDTAAHRASADDGTRRDRPRLDILTDTGNFRGFPLGKKGIAQRLRLFAILAAREPFAVGSDRLVVGHGQPVDHAGERLHRRFLATHAPPGEVAVFLDHFGRTGRAGQCPLSVRWRAAVVDLPAKTFSA